MVGAGGLDDVLNAQDIGLHRFERGFFAQAHMLEGGGMEDHVNTRHFAACFVAVTHVSQEKTGVAGPGVFLLLKKEGAFVVVQADHFSGGVFVHHLPHQFTANAAATTGHQNRFVFKKRLIVHRWLITFFFKPSYNFFKAGGKIGSALPAQQAFGLGCV